MIKIAILGTGNVGSHLHKAFGFDSGIESILISSRTPELIPRDVDAILIAVSDAAIHKVAQKVASIFCSSESSDQKPVLFHTSGSTDLSVLAIQDFQHGVIYPLQTFSKGVDLNYSEIPVFIEATDEPTKILAEKIASGISNSVFSLSSENRRRLHLASVFACNYANHLWAIAQEIVGNIDLPAGTLTPLIRETVRKLSNVSAKEAQTGPARRGDEITIKKHLNMLSDNPDWQELYRLCAQQISERYQPKH